MEGLFDRVFNTVLSFDFPTIAFRLTVALLGLFSIDMIFARKSPARWFILHAVYNFICAFLAFPDVFMAFTNPTRSMDHGPFSTLPFYVVVSVHLYHMIAFRSQLKRDDYTHHIVFVGGITLIGTFGGWGHIENCYCFFMSGLPGGIDYVLLSLVKHQKMDPITEKHYNARINVWLRSPGCLLSAFVLYIGWLHSTKSQAHPLAIIVLCMLCAVNGQYYMQQVVGNTYRKDEAYSS